MTPESTRPVGEETRKLRAEHREASRCSPQRQASISGRQRHLRNIHTVSRLTCSQEAESHTAEEPGAHGSIRNPRLLPAGGGAPGVSGVSADPPASLIGTLPMTSLLCVSAGCPCSMDPLALPRAGSSMPLPVLHSPSAKGGCEASTRLMPPYVHNMTCSPLSAPS